MLHIPRLSITTRALALSAAAVITPVVLNAQVPTGWQAITDASGEYTVRADGAPNQIIDTTALTLVPKTLLGIFGTTDRNASTRPPTFSF